MHRNIDTSGKKRSLDFRREQSFSSRTNIDNLHLVAFRRDNFCLDPQFRSHGLNCFLNQAGLGARKLAAARAEDDFLIHSFCRGS